MDRPTCRSVLERIKESSPGKLQEVSLRGRTAARLTLSFG